MYQPHRDEDVIHAPRMALIAVMLAALFLGVGWLAAQPVARTRDGALGLPLRSVGVRQDSAQQVALGRRLFMERRLSSNATMSCAMCHVPEQGFTAADLRTPIGVHGRSLRRNSPSLLNVGFNRNLFLDGRETRLEAQVWGPLLAADEMGQPDAQSVVRRVAALPGYTALFDAAFPGRGLTSTTFAEALAAYERSLTAGAAPFDRWYFAGDGAALPALAREGWQLFRGKAGCVACHRVATDHALFTDQRFHNIGTGWPQRPLWDAVRLDVIPGQETLVPAAIIAELSGPHASDEGRFEVTHRPEDRRAFRTPSLRNVALTAPYMHDGSLATLREVIEYYDAGGTPDPGKDGHVRPLRLSQREKEALLAFLESLTSPQAERLAREARADAVPTGALR